MARVWTSEETNFLQERWGEYDLGRIAKNLNRSESAIYNKVARLGLGSFLENGDYITLNTFLNHLRGVEGVGRSYTIKQLINKGLPVKYRKRHNAKIKVIYIDDFWKWAKKHRTIIDFSNMEENIFGAEPQWVKEQRVADKKHNNFYKNTPWTKSEDNYLISLVKQFKYGYKEISIKTKRTEGAIKRRLSDLKIKERPLRSPNSKWTDEKISKVIELYKKGYSPDIISLEIDGKSAQAVSGRMERLITDGELEPRSKFRKSR